MYINFIGEKVLQASILCNQTCGQPVYLLKEALTVDLMYFDDDDDDCYPSYQSSGSFEHAVYWCGPAVASTSGENGAAPLTPSSGPSEFECSFQRTGMKVLF